VSTAVAVDAGPHVGIGQIVASGDQSVVISALGLGSCIGVVLVDLQAKVAGMAHVMLPQSAPNSTGPPGKFADTALPALVEAVTRLGAQESRLVAKIAGGAQMFGSGSGGGLLKIGERNAEAVAAALGAAGLRLRAGHIGGNSGRTMQVVVGTGLVTVRAVGGTLIEL
jgi:chemotaxis protein CheD